MSKDASPYVCLSAHCDLLHFIGPVPHPYGGPTPQTIAERASRYVRFSCESSETKPTVTVTCDHPLFSSVPVTNTADVVPSFPLNGVELARWAYRENFESVAAQPQLDPHEKKVAVCRQPLQSDSTGISRESTLPQPPTAALPVEEAAYAMVSGNSCYTVNFHAVRRTLLQALLILSHPKRSPAVSFTFSMHDPSPLGATCFFLLPRCAEKTVELAHPAKVSLSVGNTSDGDILHCSCQIATENGEEEKTNLSSPLLWELNGEVEKEQHSEAPVELNHFITKTMIPILFALPETLSRPNETEAAQHSQIVGWTQRRSFHLLALIAHSVWCEKVALYFMNRNSGPKALSGKWKACLKTRDNASLESTDKWESTLFLFPEDSAHSKGTRKRSKAVDANASCAAGLQIIIKGCDEQMSWEFGGSTPNASSGTLSDLSKLYDKKK